MAVMLECRKRGENRRHVVSNMTNYDEARSTFTIAVPERFNFVGDVMHRRAEETPNRVALIAVEPDGSTVHRYTFGEIVEQTHRAARVMRALGVGPGDRVFVQLPRIVEWHVTLLACIQIGAVPMPATTQLTANDQKYRINRAGAVAAVCDAQGAERLNEVAADCPTLKARILVGPWAEGWTSMADAMRLVDAEPALVAPTQAEDPLLLYFTSGTTGKPKMVQHIGSYALGHEITARFWHDLTSDDVHWTVSDTGWAKAAWGKLFGQWTIGATVVMWNIEGKPNLERLLELIGELEVTSFCAPPTLYRAFAQMDLGDYDWSSLRHCTSAGEPLNPDVISIWQEATGTTPYDGYGQTETVCIVANYPCLEVRPGSMGKPTPGINVEVVDEDGSILGHGEEGHIAVRTDPWPVGLFEGYWRDDEQTADVFRNGWYYTGDRAYRDADGYFWFVGRADDVILSSAYRIGPFEVESALIEHEAVAEAAVVGKPDEARGNIVMAYVVLAEGFPISDGTTSDDPASHDAAYAALVAELQTHVKSVTAPYKYPRQIEFVDDLPKTISGKIRRVELRERALRAGLPHADARNDDPTDSTTSPSETVADPTVDPDRSAPAATQVAAEASDDETATARPHPEDVSTTEPETAADEPPSTEPAPEQSGPEPGDQPRWRW